MTQNPPNDRKDREIDKMFDSVARPGSSSDFGSDAAADHPPTGSDQSVSIGGDRLPWQVAARIVARLADTADELHLENRVHGRIGPQAITVGPDGEPFLAATDFAAPTSPKYDQNDHSTLAVVAPECIDNTGARIDGRTDVYGLGIVLYHMLCGRGPFRAQDVGVLRRQITKDAPQPPRQLVHGVPREIESTCLRALSKNPDRRFQSAAQLATALRAALEDEDSASQSSIYLSVPQAPEAPSRQSFVIVKFTLPGDDCDSLVATGSVRGAIMSRLDELAVACLRDIAVEQVDWSGNGLAFQVRADSPDEVTEATVAAGLQLLSRMAELFVGTETTPSTGSHPIVVRVQGAEFGDQLIGDVGNVGGRLQIDDLPLPRTRLEATFQANHIALTRGSMEMVGRWFACTAADNNRDLWTVSGDNIPELGVRVWESAELPFQGRNPQLSILRDRWVQACDGMGQIVLLIGEEGMGKTRLVSELKRFTRESTADGVFAVEWNCLPRYGSEGLQPAAAWFRHLLGLGEEDGPAERRRRLAEHLQQYDVDSMEVVEGLADLVGAAGGDELADELTQTQRKQRMRNAVAQWLKAVARSSPVLFIVEDLQWADPATLTLISQFLDQGLNDRLLTILTLRPEFETPWGSRAHQTQITLNRFSRRHVAAALAAAWETSTVEEAVLEAAMAETQGVPMDVEEFVRRTELPEESPARPDKGTSPA